MDTSFACCPRNNSLIKKKEHTINIIAFLTSWRRIAFIQCIQPSSTGSTQMATSGKRTARKPRSRSTHPHLVLFKMRCQTINKTTATQTQKTPSSPIPKTMANNKLHFGGRRAVVRFPFCTPLAFRTSVLVALFCASHRVYSDAPEFGLCAIVVCIIYVFSAHQPFRAHSMRWTYVWSVMLLLFGLIVRAEAGGENNVLVASAFAIRIFTCQNGRTI